MPWLGGPYPAPGQLPSGYGFSPEHQGTDSTTDSDVNAQGFTDFFTLQGGQNQDDLDAGLMPLF